MSACIFRRAWLAPAGKVSFPPFVPDAALFTTVAYGLKAAEGFVSSSLLILVAFDKVEVVGIVFQWPALAEPREHLHLPTGCN